MGLARSALGAAIPLMLALPATAVAAPGWVTPVASVGAAQNGVAPLVASNARGDTAVAWLDPTTKHVFVSERPVGGTFTTGAEVDATADQRLGSIQLDAAGNIYVFYITQQETPASSRPWVAVKPIGGSTWTPTGLAPAASQDPPQDPIVGAVAPDGSAVAVWFQGHTQGATQSVFQYSTKPAGSSTWAGKQLLSNFQGNAPGVPRLAINSAGQAVVAFVKQLNTMVMGATMNTFGTFTALNQVNTTASSSGIAIEIGTGIDQTGRATVVWSRSNGTNQIVQFTSTTAGTAFPMAPASGAANDLSATGADASFPALATAPDGATTVAWIRGGALEERTRAAGGSAFAAQTTIPNTLATPSGTLLAPGGDGSTLALWSGTDSAKPAVASARRAPGGSAFTAGPQVPATDNAFPSLAADGEGNGAAAWNHFTTTGSTYGIQATGLDTVGPVISDVVFPSSAPVGTPFSYGATLVDRWSQASANGSWAFGDGTTGALSGTKAYGANGSFVATLTASDSFSNTTTATRPIIVGTGVPPGGLPGGTDIVAPLLTARLTNTIFAVNPKGPAEVPVAAAAKKGTTFVYSITEAARVVFTIRQKLPGRRVRGRCVKPTRRNASRRKCTRFVKRGAFAQNGGIGVNRKKFSGRIGKRTLRPGRYRARVVARDAAGNASKRVSLNFRIVRR
jgi:PKD domain